MTSLLCSQGMVLATAMAVSGTVILLALRLQKSLPPPLFPLQQPIPPSSHHQQAVLRSCISSDGKEKNKNKNKKNNKRVHFAEDVVMDSRQEVRRRQVAIVKLAKSSSSSSSSSSQRKFNTSTAEAAGRGGDKESGMPANRVALYNGILRDRLVQRLAYSC